MAVSLVLSSPRQHKKTQHHALRSLSMRVEYPLRAMQQRLNDMQTALDSMGSSTSDLSLTISIDRDPWLISGHTDSDALLAALRQLHSPHVTELTVHLSSPPTAAAWQAVRHAFPNLTHVFIRGVTSYEAHFKRKPCPLEVPVPNPDDFLNLTELSLNCGPGEASLMQHDRVKRFLPQLLALKLGTDTHFQWPLLFNLASISHSLKHLTVKSLSNTLTPLLLNHAPALEHITVAKVNLKQDWSLGRCRWKTLTITGEQLRSLCWGQLPRAAAGQQLKITVTKTLQYTTIGTEELYLDRVARLSRRLKHDLQLEGPVHVSLACRHLLPGTERTTLQTCLTYLAPLQQPHVTLTLLNWPLTADLISPLHLATQNWAKVSMTDTLIYPNNSFTNSLPPLALLDTKAASPVERVRLWRLLHSKAFASVQEVRVKAESYVLPPVLGACVACVGALPSCPAWLARFLIRVENHGAT